MLIPVGLAVVVFPTAMYDTRELIAWGREFPLTTPYHPPLMAWVGGIVDRLAGTSAVAAIAAGQLLMALGIYYVWRVLRIVSSPTSAVFFTFLYATSTYIVFGPLSRALNADVLQLTSWPAILFYFFSAHRTNKLTQFMALGFWSAIAFLTKYNALVLLAGLGVSMAVIPAYRAMFREWRLYAGVVIGLALIAPHVVAAFNHVGPIEYGVATLNSHSSLLMRLDYLANWIVGAFIGVFPGLLAVVFGWYTGVLRFDGGKDDVNRDARLALLVTTIAINVVVLGLILAAGLAFRFRYSPPYSMVAVLAVAPWVTWRADAGTWINGVVARSIGVFNLAIALVLIVVYTFFASHSGMQEPTKAAAAAILADWRSRYSCGPGYFFGVRQNVYGVGIEAGRDVTTLSGSDIAGASWFDPERWHRDGAVIIDTPEEARNWQSTYQSGPSATAEASLALPLRRTFLNKQYVYSYHFIAPHGCAARREAD